MATTHTGDTAAPRPTSGLFMPSRKRGRRSSAQQAEHEAALEQFYDSILEIKSRLQLPRRELRQRFADMLVGGWEVRP